MVARIYSDTVEFETDREPWMDDAACSQERLIDDGKAEPIDPEEFFPYHRPKDKVIELCKGCDVRLKCLAFALEMERPNNDKRFGIWGGLDPGERRKLQKQLDAIRKAQAAQKKEEDSERSDHDA